MSKPRLAIVGIGQYYRKLESAINEYFTPVLKADIAEVQAAGGALKPMVLNSRPDAILLLTPNQVHAEQILDLADLRIPTLVEKPLVTTEKDLDLVLESLRANPLLYCSDFYLDVRAAPLLAWLGRPYSACLKKWIVVEADGKDLWGKGQFGVGAIKRVEAVLLEGEGPERSFDGREWLWDALHGGVLWDLAYHYVVLWHGLFGGALSLVSYDAGRVRNALARPGAETYATLELRSSTGIPFFVRVGKYQEHENQRSFRIVGTNGQACMMFRDPDVFRIEAQAGGSVAILTGSFYSHGVEAFREYVESEPSRPHGLEHAIVATRLIASVKQMQQATYNNSSSE